jgi:penicillin-binding protein 2
MTPPLKSIDYKLKLFSTGIGLFISLILFRLVYLQIHLADSLRDLSKKNFTRTQSISSIRGNIMDKNGKLLATNRPVINVFWQGNNSNKDKSYKIITNINNLLGKPTVETVDSIKAIERMYQKHLITSDISVSQLSQIVEQAPTSKLIIETGFQRYYPYRSTASHIIGYLSQLDWQTMGKTGLERMFEQDLKGLQGKKTIAINAIGKNIYQLDSEPATTGKDIRTTLDLSLQRMLEISLPKDFASAAIIIESDTGAIRAVASRPNFNPSTFLKPLSYTDWCALQEKKPFINRAFNAAYPPASIFKLITMIAALEEGIVDEETEWNCKGFIKFGKRKYHCNQRDGHGTVDLKDAIIHSCNIPFFEIGKEIKIDTLAKYAKMFGLGEKTGLLFAEKSGLIPTKQWKQETKGEVWWPGETLSAVIGQSYLLTTPIQIALMLNAIFKKKLIKPRIIESQPIEEIDIPIKDSTINAIKEPMKLTVTEGTAKRLNKLKEFDIYAKTGTAQTGALEKRNLGKQFLEHVWFVGQIKHPKYPEFSLVILVENAGAARIAIWAARDFLKTLEKHLQKK